MTAHLQIDLAAIRHNVRTLAALAAPSRTMFAVKADAYGLGMVPVARAGLDAGADSLAVLDVPAALTLREAGITAPLFAWLHGARTDFGAAIAADIDLGVSSPLELGRIADAATDVPARVHLKIDTGLHRNGADPETWPELVSTARSMEVDGRVRIVGLWSHLADASPADDAIALAEFRSAVAVAAALGVPVEGPDRVLLHLAASSAGIRMPEARLDLVRFGIAAYGVSPFDDIRAGEFGMRGPVRLIAEVIEVSEGRAVLDVGSADGLPPSVLHPARGAEVLLGGVRTRVLQVDVDTITVEAAPGVQTGAEAIVYGPGDDGEPTVEDWADWAGSIGDEILSRASRRIPRSYND